LGAYAGLYRPAAEGAALELASALVEAEGKSMTEFTARDKRIAAEQEVRWRLYVYPKRVAAGKMQQKSADRNVALMKAIAEDYRKLEAEEEAKGRLL
jgi:hypothetical protein